jgi:hypothetical protein
MYSLTTTGTTSLSHPSDLLTGRDPTFDRRAAVTMCERDCQLSASRVLAQVHYRSHYGEPSPSRTISSLRPRPLLNNLVLQRESNVPTIGITRERSEHRAMIDYI